MCYVERFVALQSCEHIWCSVILMLALQPISAWLSGEEERSRLPRRRCRDWWCYVSSTGRPNHWKEHALPAACIWLFRQLYSSRPYLNSELRYSWPYHIIDVSRWPCNRLALALGLWPCLRGLTFAKKSQPKSGRSTKFTTFRTYLQLSSWWTVYQAVLNETIRVTSGFRK